MIENALDGKQLDIKKKAYMISFCLGVIGLAITFYAASSIEPVTSVESSSTTAYITQEADL